MTVIAVGIAMALLLVFARTPTPIQDVREIMQFPQNQNYPPSWIQCPIVKHYSVRQ